VSKIKEESDLDDPHTVHLRKVCLDYAFFIQNLVLSRALKIFYLLRGTTVVKVIDATKSKISYASHYYFRRKESFLKTSIPLDMRKKWY